MSFSAMNPPRKDRVKSNAPVKNGAENTFRFKQPFYSITNLLKNQALFYERVEKVDTLPTGNAARSKINDFRTALYPRGYPPQCP